MTDKEYAWALLDRAGGVLNKALADVRALGKEPYPHVAFERVMLMERAATELLALAAAAKAAKR